MVFDISVANNYLSFIIDSDNQGKRLDLVSYQLLGTKFSRVQVQRLITEGRLLLDNKKARSAMRVKAGQNLIIKLPILTSTSINLLPEFINFKVLYEDDYLIIVNKPSGIVVHPAVGHSVSTLVHGLLYYCGELAPIGGPLRPGIVHRLDKGTSGALVAAKKDVAYRGLLAAFASGHVNKEYLALVWNYPPERGKIETGIGRHPTDRKRMSSRAIYTKPALSYWRVVNRFPSGLSLLRVRIHTGRTHQIRVHCYESGWPLVGDPLYGKQRLGRYSLFEELAQAIKNAGRQLLHAVCLGFKHPVTKGWVEVTAPLPLDFRAVLKAAENEKNKKAKTFLKKKRSCYYLIS